MQKNSTNDLDFEKYVKKNQKLKKIRVIEKIL